MKELSTYQIVLTKHLNHHGTLFVGQALIWLSETGFMTATMSYNDPNELVYYALNNFKFYKPVQKGAIVKFEGLIVKLGNSSITVNVKGMSTTNDDIYMEGLITYVCIDRITRKKKSHGLKLDEATNEKEIKLRAMTTNAVK